MAFESTIKMVGQEKYTRAEGIYLRHFVAIKPAGHGKTKKYHNVFTLENKHCKPMC